MSRDVPPGAQCYRDGCTREAVDPDHPAGFCERHKPESDDDEDQDRGQNVGVSDSTPAFNGGQWGDADFTSPKAGTWPTPHITRDQWMAREGGNKAPWADDDAPVECSHTDHDDATTCDECAHSATYKWGSDGSREHVHADADTAREWATMHPECNGDLVYIQREDSPFAFIDGDDVRCPETDKVHPAFLAILEHLGLTYADVSTSGTGVHAPYKGEIPLDGVGQAAFEIDTEPWGANDDPPTVEIYANKHV